jgi:exopolysaccharide production protein ExoQ
MGAGEVFATVMGVLIILIFSQGWLVPIFGDKTGAAEGGLIRAAYFPAYAAGLIVLLSSGFNMFRAIVRQPFLIFLMLLAGFSYFWSISPSETMRRVIALWLTTLAGVALASRFRWGQMIEIMAIALGILTVLSLVASAAIPSIGRMAAGSEFPGAWRGLWVEKNALGGNMSLFFPVFASAAIFHPKRRWLWWGLAALAVALVLASTSKTSLLALMLAVGGVAMVAMIQANAALAVVTVWLAVVGIGLIAAVIVFGRDMVLEALGKDSTLTGRTNIWKAVLTQIQNHPWLGHGYGTIWSDDNSSVLKWIVKIAGFRPQHSHNSWLEQWLWLGMTGLIGWSLFFLQTLFTAIVAMFRERGALLAMGFLLPYAMISLTESETLIYNDLRWCMFVAIAVKLAFPDPPPQPVYNPVY